jgi:putative flippase GtrA
MPASMKRVTRGAPLLTGQFLRFGLVGTIGFIVDASVLRLVVSQLGLNLYIGRVISFLAAATVTWALNRTFTFRHKGARGTQWLRFVMANALGGFVNFGTYAAMVSSMPFVHAHPVIAVAAGSIAGLGFNFTLSKWLVFR